MKRKLLIYNSKASIITFLILLLSCKGFGAEIRDYFQQDSTKTKSSDKAEQLYKANKLEETLQFCKKELSFLLNQNIKDSTEIAWLNYYQFETQYHFKDYFESLKSAEQGILYSPSSQEGREIEAVLYYKKAYAEDQLKFSKRSLTSMEKSASLLLKLKQPNYDYIVGAYNFLSQNAAYHGNLEEAKRYLRLAKNIYEQNKKLLDDLRTEPDGNYDRYQVILPYKNIYVLYKLGKTKTDSLFIEKKINDLEALHQEPEFNVKYESVYYTTALNHVGDWYASHKQEDSISTLDLKKAHEYIDKSIYFVEKKGYSGNLIVFKFNKCKALTLSNQLKDADHLISILLKEISKTDGRYPFFQAQKGFIKAKMKQKDSALISFKKAVEKIHTGKEVLKKDFSNFKPSQSFGHTKLLLRIADKLNTFYKEDKEVNKSIAQLYYLAFLQFENSYNQDKYNKTYNQHLKKIIQGILKMKQKGYGYNSIDDTQFLDKTETIKNKLEWLNFYQNRYTNTLPELDSLQFKKLKLRKALTKAKLDQNIALQDSLLGSLEEESKAIAKKFPDLAFVANHFFSTKELQSQLRSDQLILKYIIVNNDLIVYKINSKQIDVEIKPWSDLEKKLVFNLTENSKNRKITTNTSKDLAKILLPEINMNVNHLIINPDDILYRLPFEILQVNDEYLNEKYSISYTSNLGFIKPTTKRNHKSKHLAIYAPSYALGNETSTTRSGKSALFGANKEALSIADLFPSEVYLGSKLTKEHFFETAKNAKILHLAMHAEVDNNESGLSKLLFNQNDEYLYLEELYGLSLSADLAVLSACNTGIGKENAGKGMESFQRAFTSAGVPATIASLWEVPDFSTNLIMQNFYYHLSKGLSISEALQKAKLDYLNKNKGTKLAQPYYWAGFVLYGTDAPVTTPNGAWIWILVFVLVALLAIAIYLKRLKRRTS